MAYGNIHKKQWTVTGLSPRDLLSLIKEKPLPFLLESRKMTRDLGRKSYLGFAPVQTLRSKGNVTILEGEMEGTITDAHPLDLLRTLMSHYPSTIPDRFPGGAVGCLSYDFTAYNLGMELKAERQAEVWDCYFGIYTAILEYDTLSGDYTLFYQDPDDLEEWEELFRTAKTSTPLPVPDHANGYEIGLPDDEPYREAFKRIKEHIKRGDVYEVNLAHSFIALAPEDAFTLYTLLEEANPADFMAYMDFGEYQVLSSSPERFFEVTDGLVKARPIKGTISRGKTYEEDRKAAETLLHSEKDVSELLMIVDLMRNDLARSCDYESIRVDEMYRLETYEKVHHLVSTIEGRLRPEEDPFSLMRHIFPGGSITGAPKRASIEVIDEVEAYARNVYTGSIGYFSFNGNADFNILIRTILKVGDTSYFYGGGAITWDSDEEAELEETLDKCLPILQMFLEHKLEADTEGDEKEA